MPRRIALTFQDCASLQITHLSNLHDFIISVIIIVIILILYTIIYIITRKFYYKFIREGTLIETIWSIVPALILIILVFPSIKILYLSEDIKKPHTTIKIIGHQWYWTYVTQRPLKLKITNDKESWVSLRQIKYDSVIDWETPRVLKCTNYLLIPEIINSRLLISATDVIHSFSVPALGLKVDGVPGRINQIFLSPIKKGLFIGICSEICGANHAFIPISLKVVRGKEFLTHYKINLAFSLTQIFKEIKRK